MADEPIQSDLTAVMNITMEKLVKMLPSGMIITLMVTVPDGFPGAVPLKPGSRTNYICNGHRDDMANAMIEMLKRWGKL